jgi:hypothetical protein
MKRFFLGLSLLLSAQLAVNTVQAQGKPSYKIACIGFYNFENLFDTLDTPDKSDTEFTPNGEMHYNTFIYTDKLAKLSDVVSQMGDKTPDGVSVLGIAEIENRSVLEDFVKQPKIANRNYKIVWFDSPDKRGIDVAFIYQSKYFKPESFKQLPVTGRLENGDTLWTRDILLMSGLYDGEPMHFMVGHWPSRRGGETATKPLRERAAGVCRRATDSILAANPKAKVIIMGDLNDNPDDASITKILSAKGKEKDLKEGDLFNPFTSWYNKGLGTLAHNDAWGLFDQIIISQNFLGQQQSGFFYRESEVFRKPFLMQKNGRYKGYPKRTFSGAEYLGGYSDHLPTQIYLYKEIPKK